MRTKVLVVDDNDNIRIFVSSLLTRYGHEVVQASNGLNAIKILSKDNDIKLVLLDIMMPIMNGYDFLKAIKKKPKLNYFKICMMTAVSSRKEIVESLKLGAHDYIVKIIDKDILLDKVERLTINSEDNHFVTINTKLSANIIGSPFKLQLTITELAENFMILKTPLELNSNETILIKVPYLNERWKSEIEFICVVEESHKISTNEFSSKLILTGLCEDISIKLRELTINKRRLIQDSDELVG
jgi:DNA-binding response OmpR family regulator